MTEYTLYKVADNYTVTWYDETLECEVAQDTEGGEVYPFSGWVEEPTGIVGTYDSLNDAWWSACVDPYLTTGDPRLHPNYSYKLKDVAE